MNKVIEWFYNFLWGDLFTLHFGDVSIGIPLLVLLLIPAGIFFTIRTKFMPVRKFPQMIRALSDKNDDKTSLSTFQTLIVSTATRVGMGNLVGVVAAISIGGAGAVFGCGPLLCSVPPPHMLRARLHSFTRKRIRFMAATTAARHIIFTILWSKKEKKKIKKSFLAILFAFFGLICWCGISQVISNSVTSAFKNAFSIPPIYTTVVLVALAAVIVLRKNATVKFLDVVVPVMAVLYFAVTIFIILKNIKLMPGVFSRIFQEAFGFKQIAGGGFGAVLMNGVKRGLFSNEAGSGSAPCAASRGRGQKARNGRNGAIPWSFDRHNCYLHLHGNDYARLLPVKSQTDCRAWICFRSQ